MEWAHHIRLKTLQIKKTQLHFLFQISIYRVFGIINIPSVSWNLVHLIRDKKFQIRKHEYFYFKYLLVVRLVL